eukprot:1363520-Amorphochlora_amoeboformis.AAC.1
MPFGEKLDATAGGHLPPCHRRTILRGPGDTRMTMAASPDNAQARTWVRERKLYQFLLIVIAMVNLFLSVFFVFGSSSTEGGKDSGDFLKTLGPGCKFGGFSEGRGGCAGHESRL